MAGSSGGDKVKKGFFFYVFMLFLLLIAAFLIIVMIMLFSPFKPILGYQYFNYNKSYVCVKTTDETGTDLDFSTINKISVNTGYADVSIVKNTDEEAGDSISVSNKAKGFAGAADYVDFECSVLVEDGTLSINVKEPQSFLYFSQDVSIQILVSKDSVDNLSNAQVVINTKTGDVTIGSANKDAAAVDIADLSITTDSGNIVLNENDSEEEEIIFDSLLLSTGSGRVTIAEGKTVVRVLGETKFSILTTGNMNFNEIYALYGIQLTVNNGSFHAEKITGRVSVSNIKNGSIDINVIARNGVNENTSAFNTNNAEEIERANIKIGEVSFVAIPSGNQANIEIGTLNGSSIIRTTSGNINIKDHAGTDFHFETETGSININLKDEESAYVYNRVIASQKGNITVKFEGTVRNIHNIRTNGNIEIVLPQNSKFLLDLYKMDTTPIDKLGGNVNISNFNAPDYSAHFKLNYRDGDDESIFQNNQVLIFSDGKINVHLA